jgi:hypothetical protein
MRSQACYGHEVSRMLRHRMLDTHDTRYGHEVSRMLRHDTPTMIPTTVMRSRKTIYFFQNRSMVTTCYGVHLDAHYGHEVVCFAIAC